MAANQGLEERVTSSTSSSLTPSPIECSFLPSSSMEYPATVPALPPSDEGAEDDIATSSDGSSSVLPAHSSSLALNSKGSVPVFDIIRSSSTESFSGSQRLRRRGASSSPEWQRIDEQINFWIRTQGGKPVIRFTAYENGYYRIGLPMVLIVSPTPGTSFPPVRETYIWTIKGQEKGVRPLFSEAEIEKYFYENALLKEQVGTYELVFSSEETFVEENGDSIKAEKTINLFFPEDKLSPLLSSLLCKVIIHKLPEKKKLTAVPASALPMRDSPATTSVGAPRPRPHSHYLRTGFCKNPFFDRNFKGTRLSRKVEPRHGYKDSNYFSFALMEVFDAESRYFWLEKQKSGLVPSASSRGWNAVKLFFGVQDFWWGNGIDMSPHTRGFALFLYVGLGGWVLSPVINVVKAFTELPLKLLAEFFCWSKDSLREKYGEGYGINDAATFKAMGWYWQVLYFICRTLQLLFAGLHLLVRMVVSPVESAKVAYNAGYTHGWLNQALTIISAVTSTLFWTGFLIGGGPLLLLIAPKLGISLAPVAHSGLANFSAPVMTFLTTNFGFVVSTALTGVVALSTTLLFFLGLHEARKDLNTFFAAGREDKGPMESRYLLIK